MSFEKRKDFAFFTEEDFKGKTDFLSTLTWKMRNKMIVKLLLLLM